MNFISPHTHKLGATFTVIELERIAYPTMSIKIIKENDLQ
jgi:PHP family Zn ribbon phosphoesterase